MHPTAEDLSALPLLAALTDDQRATLARHVEVTAFRPGEVLLTEGASSYAFFLVRAGEVEVRRGGGTVARLRKGDFFGELGLLDDAPRNATVVGSDPGVVWFVYGSTFKVLRAQHPQIADAVESVARERRSVTLEA